MARKTPDNFQEKGLPRPAAGTSEIENLMTVTNLVKNYITSIERAKNDLLKQREMLEDALSNNSQYKEACEEAKEASKIKADVKRQILEQEKLLDLSNKIKELSLNLKETKSALSEYLVEYSRLSGSKQIEGDDGKTLEIVYTAHLVKTQGTVPN
jgi:predicted RNase H-like nuclease (RuvC/YqgF family)